MKSGRTIACTTLALALLTACAEEKSNVRDYNAERAAGASSAPAAPAESAPAAPAESAPAAPETPAAPAENAAGDIARFNTFPTSGDDAAWCGPAISYLTIAEERGNSLGPQGLGEPSPETLAIFKAAAKDASDATTIPGLPEDVKKLFTDLERLSAVFVEGREPTEEELELSASQLEQFTAVGETFAAECPATVAAAEEASAE